MSENETRNQPGQDVTPQTEEAPLTPPEEEIPHTEAEPTEEGAPEDIAADAASGEEVPQDGNPQDGTPQKKSGMGIGARILMIAGIVVLLLLLIGGGIVLAALRQLRGDEYVPIVSRDSEYVIDTMAESYETMSWEDFATMGDEEDTTVPETEDVTETKEAESTAARTEAVTKPVQVPIYEQHKNNKDIINILLLGRDARNAKVEYGRTDTMIILSYNQKTKEVKMVSLLRDMLVPIEGHDYNRINTAYAFGGIGLCINTINTIFQLDIQDYVTIDFEGLKSVIDSIGGIDLELTADEVYMYREEGLMDKNAKAGVHHLNGAFALRHARNRALGSDFERTRRQRDILMAVFDKVTSSLTLSEVTNLVSSTLKMVNTNLSAKTLVSLATDVMKNKDKITIDTGRVPYNGTYQGILYKKMAVIQIDFAENIRLLHEFLYGEE